jgi:hypothetical protein
MEAPQRPFTGPGQNNGLRKRVYVARAPDGPPGGTLLLCGRRLCARMPGIPTRRALPLVYSGSDGSRGPHEDGKITCLFAMRRRSPRRCAPPLCDK